jgi:hypothetical protein
MSARLNDNTMRETALRRNCIKRTVTYKELALMGCATRPRTTAMMSRFWEPERPEARAERLSQEPPTGVITRVKP